MSSDPSSVEVKREASTPASAPSEGWGPLLSLRDEIDRLFDDIGAGAWRRPLSHRVDSHLPTAGTWAVTPAIELIDRSNDYLITAELPGMTPETVEIKLTDGSITIRGEKSEARKEEQADYLLSERRYGAFHRSLPLPAGIDTDAIAASFANGVLTVTLPKLPDTKQQERKIEVKKA